MPKFCGFCGMQMEDNANACANCGTPVQPAAPVQPVTPVQPVESNQNFYQQPTSPVSDYEGFDFYPQTEASVEDSSEGEERNVDVNAIIGDVKTKLTTASAGISKSLKKNLKNENFKKYAKFGGIGVAALVVVFIIVSLFSGGAEEKLAKKLLKAIDNDKASSVVKLLPDFYFEDNNFSYIMSEEDWVDNFAGRIESFRDQVSDELNSNNFSMKWKVTDVDAFGDRSMNDLENALAIYQSFKENKLKKGAAIFAEIECKKGGEAYCSEVEIVAYKYGSSWYLYSWNIKESVEN